MLARNLIAKLHKVLLNYKVFAIAKEWIISMPSPQPAYTLAQITAKLTDKFDELQAENALRIAESKQTYNFEVISQDLLAILSGAEMKGRMMDFLVMNRRSMQELATVPENRDLFLKLTITLHDFIKRKETLSSSPLVSRGFDIIELNISLIFNFSFMCSGDEIVKDRKSALLDLLRLFKEDVEFFSNIDQDRLARICVKVAESNDDSIFTLLPSRMRSLDYNPSQDELVEKFLDFKCRREPHLLEESKRAELVKLPAGQEVYDLLCAFDRLNRIRNPFGDSLDLSFDQEVQHILDGTAQSDQFYLSEIVACSEPIDIIIMARKIAALVNKTDLNNLRYTV